MTKKRTFTSVRGQRSFREEGDARGQKQAREHVSVMPREALGLLAVHDGEVVVDATYGAGGHSAALRKAAKVQLVALDADPSVKGKEVVTANFADLSQVLKELHIPKIDKALFDLGWNRAQLASGRGFSFLTDEPLSMSYGPKPRSGYTAADILNTFTEQTLADIFFGYGEERYARRIARAVVERRAVQPFATTMELVEVVRDAVPAAYRRGRIHPATRTFQALRIAVNDELGALDQGLHSAWEHLALGGRIVVITFHSIEDRAVKQLFASLSKAGEGRLVVKKPLAPTEAEVRANPAARSAKLRAIEKI